MAYQHHRVWLHIAVADLATRIATGSLLSPTPLLGTAPQQPLPCKPARIVQRRQRCSLLFLSFFFLLACFVPIDKSLCDVDSAAPFASHSFVSPICFSEPRNPRPRQAERFPFRFVNLLVGCTCRIRRSDCSCRFFNAFDVSHVPNTLPCNGRGLALRRRLSLGHSTRDSASDGEPAYSPTFHYSLEYSTLSSAAQGSRSRRVTETQDHSELGMSIGERCRHSCTW